MLIAQPESIQEVLVNAIRALGVRRNYGEARFEAELMLAHVMGISRASLLARLDERLSQERAAHFAGMVARRAQREPLAYILGHQEFYGLDFVVDRRVLIPRPETELVVERALAALKRMTHLEPLIVDVGTGSGAIALALARHAPSAQIMATDLSPDALAVAQLNARRLNLDGRVEFRNADLLEGITTPIDILTANLPYIPLERLGQLPREIREYEPRMATIAGLDGLSIVRRLLAQAVGLLARGGTALLEISEEQGQAARDSALGFFPRGTVSVLKDLAGLDRVVEVKN